MIHIFPIDSGSHKECHLLLRISKGRGCALLAVQAWLKDPTYIKTTAEAGVPNIITQRSNHMEHQKEDQEQYTSAQSETSSDSRRRDDNRSHTPIIISGSSVKVLFEPRDYPPNSASPGETTHTHPNSSVGEVKIIDDATGLGTICNGVPPNGRCTVTVFCTRTGHPDRHITVRGSTNLALTFDHQEYLPAAPNSQGSHFNPNRIITRVEIQDNNPGGQMHICTVPPNGKCTIKILDRHP